MRKILELKPMPGAWLHGHPTTEMHGGSPAVQKQETVTPPVITLFVAEHAAHALDPIGGRRPPAHEAGIDCIRRCIEDAAHITATKESLEVSVPARVGRRRVRS